MTGVLVTGAAGFISFHLISELLEKGTPVFGIDNFDPFYSKELKLKNLSDLKEIAQKTKTHFEFLESDINDITPKTFEGKKISQIFHLAAKAGVRPSLENSKGYLEANVVGTNQVLEFARQREIKDFIFGSSSSVYGNDSAKPFREDAFAVKPVSPYAASKRAGELLCHSYHQVYNLNVAALRFFTVYGPRQRPDLAIRKFTEAILNDKEITLFGDGKTSRDYTFVKDIVSGVMASAKWLEKQTKSSFEIFNLGGSSPITLKDLVKAVEKAVGKPAKIKWAPMQPGDVDHTFADISKSFETLGYEPKTSIHDGLVEFVKWFKQI